ASVLDALFEREPGARNESHGHYIQMDPARLAQAFHDLTEAWMAWIGWQDAGQGALPLIQPGAGQAAIGSEYAPGTDELRAFATGLQRALRWDAHTLRRPRGSSEDANLAGKRLLRDAALYVWLQVALSTAARGVVHPAPRRYGRSDFHPLALIADKSGHGPGEARILGLPRVVVQSLEGYDQMLDRHAAQLGLPACPGRLRDGLNTIVAPEDPPQATEWQQVRPAWIERALATWGYPWPANAMRHFVASWCADAGIPEEIARAWLNHFGEGQQPIGPYSFSRSSGIAEALAGYAEQLLGRVGADAPLGGLVNE
ncbi:MAG: hypothetical protein LLP51_11775, partial [Halorhodospira halophila]|uniref:hypothetical protein n=1 Tax=Halorhodospira halophila TaxID=1053 RepID=UPI0026F1F62C